MGIDRKGIIERLSWKSIILGILTGLGFYFGLPEYIFNIRPKVVDNLGSDVVCFIEGAICGAMTVITILKFFSQKTLPQPSARLMEEERERKLLARGLIAELELFEKEIREYKSPREAPIYSSNLSKLHLFKQQTIQNLQITYSNISRAFIGARTHSEIEKLSNQIQKTISLLKEETNREDMPT